MYQENKFSEDDGSLLGIQNNKNYFLHSDKAICWNILVAKWIRL